MTATPVPPRSTGTCSTASPPGPARARAPPSVVRLPPNAGAPASTSTPLCARPHLCQPHTNQLPVVNDKTCRPHHESASVRGPRARSSSASFPSAQRHADQIDHLLNLERLVDHAIRTEIERALQHLGGAE